ncbi:OmpA family protein [Alkalilimnicola sp. S0819]|uniref:OmpA family protein n=1 Tax=Alkalilimnicola sp. S0819 TaxID=2613922 RepID=UPI001261BB97|nr:OmpA family protein [Alkalilimnicola sp. S0819]KAB7624443.1 OmpA family protein [Alkalilimnicola sp. S0819]MPQ16276.1 OmpA family protein [Alkalilimnicola sp. S0819]
MRKQLATALLTGSLLIGGCTTMDPYTREEKTASATKGATIGAIAGAVVGIATGDDSSERRKRALIGAGVGALAGGGVGYYMDVQERKLRERLEGTGVSVTRHGDNITLNMPGNITFALDESTLRPQFTAVLNDVALVLQEYENTLIEVAGHTDSTGSDSYNQGLSERRAQSVSDYLRTRGLQPLRIITRGYGERYPVADNSTAQGRQANRRVELTLTPITRQ